MRQDPPTASNSRVRQVEAIANGTVIDHIPAEATLKVAALVSDGGDQVFIGNNLRSTRLGRKGVVKVSNRELGVRQLAALALLAPSASISLIRNYDVLQKTQVPVPERFDGIARCANPNCVTNHERWTTRFSVVCRNPLAVRCHFCERTFDTGELTLL